jgi:hypothetical protein
MKVQIRKRAKDGAYILKGKDDVNGTVDNIAAAWNRAVLAKIVQHNKWELVNKWS